MRKILLYTSLAVLLLTPFKLYPQEGNKAPNIVFINCDQMNGGKQERQNLYGSPEHLEIFEKLKEEIQSNWDW